MARTHWLLPSLVGVGLVAVAATDLYRAVRSRPVLESRPLASAELQFEPRDCLVDLGDQEGGVPDVKTGSILESAEGWQEATPDGVRTVGERAEFTLRLPVGGQRTLFLQCRPDQGRGPTPRLEVEVNGVTCGELDLGEPLGQYRVELPDGLLAAGDNRVVLTLLGRGDGRQPAGGRTLELRRMVLAEGTDADFEEIAFRPPVHLSRSDDWLLVQAAGRLQVHFEVPTSGSLLTLRYSFGGPVPEARCRIGVGRWFEPLAAVDTITEQTLSPGPDGNGEQQLFLGHHTGPTLLWIVVDRAGADAGLTVRDLRLVTDPQ